MNKQHHVLVTGGAGFIGSHTLVELIAAGFKVSVVDTLERSDYKIIEGVEAITKTKIDFHKIDCLDFAALDKLFAQNNFSSVIHFARAYRPPKL